MSEDVKKGLKEFARAVLAAAVALITSLLTN